ncbi:hypothetical protein D3856_03385 [Streptococcus mutans]|nr:hypothetical protein [Streptococcus mutans]
MPVQKALHVVSAYATDLGICYDQVITVMIREVKTQLYQIY